MKVRIDYVSNSSSSSFVLVGKIFEAEDFVKQLAKAKKLPASLLEKYENDYISVNEVLDKIYNGIDGLSIQTAGDYDGIYEVCCGLDPTTDMKDTETLDELKEQVVKMLNSIGLKAKKSEVHFVTGGSDADGMSFFD